MASREQFVAERKDGLGGSDIASVFNTGYGCRRRLWYDKRGVTPDFPRATSRAMELGTLMEGLVADWYAEDTGRQVWAVERQRHKEHPELAVNVDRMVLGSEHGGDPGVLEIKSFGVGMYGKTRREGMPEDYILQLQHGMLVTGSQWGSFAIGSRDNGAITFWDVERDEKLCGLILREGLAFWALVENGPMPDALEPDDRRCQSCEWRTRCQGNALIRLDPEGLGADIPQAEDLRDLLAAWDELNALYCHKLQDGSRGTETDFRMEEVKEQLRERLGARQAVHVGEHKVYYRGQDGRVTWDPKIAVAYERLREMVRRDIERIAGKLDGGMRDEFEAQNPPAEKFRKQGNPFRVLRIY